MKAEQLISVSSARRSPPRQTQTPGVYVIYVTRYLLSITRTPHRSRGRVVLDVGVEHVHAPHVHQHVLFQALQVILRAQRRVFLLHLAQTFLLRAERLALTPHLLTQQLQLLLQRRQLLVRDVVHLLLHHSIHDLLHHRIHHRIARRRRFRNLGTRRRLARRARDENVGIRAPRRQRRRRFSLPRRAVSLPRCRRPEGLRRRPRMS
mmetsp:Transcript_13388/g.56212  ORF Transcript_13388/g.56212 Transcript_13388/m.56212 type:complete len:206 (-) Transcript_13388:754-1371(-)